MKNKVEGFKIKIIKLQEKSKVTDFLDAELYAYWMRQLTIIEKGNWKTKAGRSCIQRTIDTNLHYFGDIINKKLQRSICKLLLEISTYIMDMEDLKTKRR